MCRVKTTKKGCNSLLTTMHNTSWYVRSTIFFCKLLFSWIEFDDFFFNFQEIYNSRLRERYGDNLSTPPDFDPDLWMEAGLSGGPDRNRVYGLSNTTVENLHVAHSVSTVRSSQSLSSKVVNSVSVGVSFFQWERNVSVSECFGVPFRGCTVHIYIYIYIFNKHNSNSR